VELGTHWGESYFTFCQAVEEAGLSCLCYAVDHWLGDDHAGHYGEEVFDEVSEYNNRYYRQFSYLLRRSFDEALAQFADDSIDLLHIDGLHTYEAVSHDFRAWLPKVRSGGIILLHDICAKHEDFGVWRLWSEIKAEFSDTFEFHHSWGLGVVGKEHVPRRTPLIESLFGGSPAVQEAVRRHYVTYASHLENVLGRFPLAYGRPAPAPVLPEVRVQVFPFGERGYSEEVCQIRKMAACSWTTLTFDLREPISLAPLRVDPGGEPGFIEIDDVVLYSFPSGDLLWSYQPASGARAMSVAGSAEMPLDDDGSFIVSTGDDPQILLAVPPELKAPVQLALSLRITPAAKQAIELFKNTASRLRSSMTGLEQQVHRLQLERDSLASQLTTAAAEAHAMAARSEETQRALAETQHALAETQHALAETQHALRETQHALAETQHELAENRGALKAAEDTVYRMHHSLSWKVTEPVRRVMAFLRSGSRASGQ